MPFPNTVTVGPVWRGRIRRYTVSPMVEHLIPCVGVRWTAALPSKSPLRSFLPALLWGAAIIVSVHFTGQEMAPDTRAIRSIEKTTLVATSQETSCLVVNAAI